MARIIDSIELPAGLRELSVAELEQVCSELRAKLISTVAESGGHFASSLGAVELTVALHHVFQTPEDRLVWDTGHQGYIHKMLTGRIDQLSTIKRKGGLSGFLRREESEYDTFGAGHAGTSVSAALGMSEGLIGQVGAPENAERRAVAIIGDGAMTAGMVFEALNHAGALGRNVIVLLNDNDMSISPNVGAIKWFFSKTLTSKYSTTARTQFKKLHEMGYIPEIVYKAIDRAEEAAQGFIASPAMLFEAFGFRYIGPVNGHQIADVITALEHAKLQDVPVLVHAATVKGKGFEPAEHDPIKWHGVPPFDPGVGEFIAKLQPTPKVAAPSYTSVFADAMCELGQRDRSVVGITAAMSTGTGLDKFQTACPEQFYDVGICEQHAVAFAAGLACEGHRPVCAIYSTFLQRAFDQVVHDVCIQELPVVFAMDRGGVVGNDGHTHQGVFDIAYLRCLPNMVVMSPRDENELRHMVYTAVQHDGPIALRYPRGSGLGVDLDSEFSALEIGKSEVLRRGSDALIVGFGPVVQHALDAAVVLVEEYGIDITVVNARFAKPLDTELLAKELPRHKVVCTVEDHALLGGFGSAVIEFANDAALGLQSCIKRFGVADEFVAHASQAEQYEHYGYDTKSIVRYVSSQVERPSAPRIVAVNQ